MDDYQKLALTTARPKDSNDELFHLVLGLVGESGEIAEKLKKIVRDKKSVVSDDDRKDVAKELGDVLWYVAVLSDYLGYDLGEIASINIKKLRDRAKRNKLGGSGDNR